MCHNSIVSVELCNFWTRQCIWCCPQNNKHCIMYTIHNSSKFWILSWVVHESYWEYNTFILSSKPTIKQVHKTMKKLNHNTNSQWAGFGWLIFKPQMSQRPCKCYELQAYLDQGHNEGREIPYIRVVKYPTKSHALREVTLSFALSRTCTGSYGCVRL